MKLEHNNKMKYFRVEGRKFHLIEKWDFSHNNIDNIITSINIAIQSENQ